MSAPQGTLWDAINSLLPGSLSTLFGAFVGRAMWHGSEVRAKRRKVLGRELIWELPILLGMWMIGLGLGDYFELSLRGTAAVCSVLAYLGPRGSEAAIERWIDGGRASEAQFHQPKEDKQP